jgi:uncharacterized metal-binding protein YceD (DUF177 family)
MPLWVNLRQAARKSIGLSGELPVAELDIDGTDELLHLPRSLAYELTAQVVGAVLLVEGRLGLDLVCECVRCLRSFACPLVLADWSCQVPLEGPEKPAAHNDSVDLTGYIREDILLALPQYPLCDTECRGLPAGRPDSPAEVDDALRKQTDASVWAELNKLKF